MANIHGMLNRAQIESVGALPSAAVDKAKGRIVYLTTDDRYYISDGSSWIKLMPDTTTTKGDLTSFSTVPARLGVGSNGQVLTADSGEATGLKWATSPSAPDQSYEINNLTLVASSVGAVALKIELKTKAGSDPSGGDPVKVGFRNSTLSSGSYNQRTISAAASGVTDITVSSGSTLGHVSALAYYIYVYLIDNSGTPELAVSSQRYEDHSIISTTAEGGAGAADSASVIYSTTARSNVPIRLIGRMLSTQTTAGTWAAVPTEIKLVPFDLLEKKGTSNGNDAPAGYVGEYIENVPGVVSTDATDTWKDVASISLTAGDWDVTGCLYFENSGATLTRLFCGISPNSGNTAAGLDLGNNYFEANHPSSSFDSSFTIPNYRVSLTTTTTYYLKVKATYTVSDIDIRSRLSARRIR